MENEGWSGEVGWIDAEKVSRLAFPPAEGTAIWVCGVDDMYVALAGSRLKPLSGVGRGPTGDPKRTTGGS